MLSPDYYRKQANSCLRLARETSDATLAKRLNALAADFMQGAMEIERHDPSRGPASRPESADNGMQPQSADRSASQRHRR
jgi:hypothetical protein